MGGGSVCGEGLVGVVELVGREVGFVGRGFCAGGLGFRAGRFFGGIPEGVCWLGLHEGILLAWASTGQWAAINFATSHDESSCQMILLPLNSPGPSYFRSALSL